LPGMAASTSDTCVFGSAPNAVAAPENSLALVVIWAWTSRPITTSHSPVSPLFVSLLIALNSFRPSLYFGLPSFCAFFFSYFYFFFFPFFFIIFFFFFFFF